MQKRVCIDVHPAEIKFMLKHFSLDNKQRLWNLCEFAFAPYINEFRWMAVLFKDMKYHQKAYFCHLCLS